MDGVGWKGWQVRKEKEGERTVMAMVDKTQFEKPCSGK